MAKKTISITFPSDEFPYLEKCCEKLGVPVEEFVISAVIEKVEEWEDKWMLDRWENDGTRSGIEGERKDPNRMVYVFEGESLKEVRYGDLVKEREAEVKRQQRDNS